jgi:hypothetical protein
MRAVIWLGPDSMTASIPLLARERRERTVALPSSRKRVLAVS